MQIEHTPWLPTNKEGINGQRIAIVGFSHHRLKEQIDSDDFTLRVMQEVIDGKLRRTAFFTRVRSYFESESIADFWSRVIFFNFLPNCVIDQKKYASGSKSQIKRAKERARKILIEHKPDKVFVFTRKGWRDFPETDQEREHGRPCTSLIEGLCEPSWGEYQLQSDRVLACGFRHPQYARGEELRKQVQTFLSRRPKSS